MVERAFDEAWIDFYPRNGKEGGAIACGVPRARQSRELTNFDGDIRDIVCGGSKFRPVMMVAVAAPGAMSRWHGEGEPVEIKEAKLRGV